MNPQIRKRVQVNRDARIFSIWDTQVLTGTSATQYTFFGSGQSQVRTDRNFVMNPLPGDQPHVIHEIGVTSLIPVMAEASDIAPVKVAAALMDSIVQVKLDQNEVLVAEVGGEYFFTPTTIASILDTTIKNVVNLASRKTFVLPEPFVLQPNQSFSFTVTLKDAANMPTTAHWASAGYANGLRIRAVMWVSKYRNGGPKRKVSRVNQHQGRR